MHVHELHNCSPMCINKNKFFRVSLDIRDVLNKGDIKSSINKDKGMYTQAHRNGENFHYSFLTLKVSPPPILHNISIYIPQIGNGGLNPSVSKHMKGQGL